MLLGREECKGQGLGTEVRTPKGCTQTPFSTGRQKRQETGFSLHRHDTSKTHSEGRRIRTAARREEEARQGSDALPPSLNPIPRGTELCWFQCLAFSPSPLPFLHLNTTVFKSEVRGLLTSLVSYFSGLTSLLTSPCSLHTPHSPCSFLEYRPDALTDGTQSSSMASVQGSACLRSPQTTKHLWAT